jgi:hypothetical protein
MPDTTISSTVNSSGEARATLTPTKNIPWSVSQVSVKMFNAPSGATCELQKNSAFITLLIAGGDVADGDPPIFLRPGDRMDVIWENCTAGDVGEATFFYNETDYS